MHVNSHALLYMCYCTDGSTASVAQLVEGLPSKQYVVDLIACIDS